ncbi:uncharacterized protein LOC106170912 [Lingula anatina]|uniref:Uncharacterized protein LOC106170912 n=1 Tax=Lingula anatina TaxID=7574 RepID=A0A1S3J7P0_LINAN|nr:uncharacterized protein LOC106170912 [Lingula anatina]|eukprot:XP_013406415.1 uncharacterized protein LOC106170912 [Lingula anatina]
MRLFLILMLLSLSLLAAVDAYTSPPFIVRHWSSRLCYDYVDWWSGGHHYEKFRIDKCSNADELVWQQVDGHFGYLKVVGTNGHCLGPWGRSAQPDDDTAIFPHFTCYSSALFTIDDENGYIKHAGGSYVHPYPFNHDKPRWQSDLIIHKDKNINNRFDFVQKNNHNAKVKIMPTPNVSGFWEKITCWLNVHKGELMYSVKVGTSTSSSSTTTHAWEVSFSAAYKIISASAKYSGSFSSTYQQQWHTETTIERRIRIEEEGGTVCIWQWVYTFDQFQDKFTFKALTLLETRSEARPTRIPVGKK